MLVMRLIVGLGLVIVLLSGVLSSMEGQASRTGGAQTLSGEWQADQATTSRWGNDQTGLADEYRFEAPFPVNALMVHWARSAAADELLAEVRVSQDGRGWTAWQRAPIDEDSDGRGSEQRAYSGALMVDPSRYIAVRLVNLLGQPVFDAHDLRVTYLNTLAGPGTDSLAGSGTDSQAGSGTDSLAASGTDSQAGSETDEATGPASLAAPGDLTSQAKKKKTPTPTPDADEPPSGGPTPTPSAPNGPPINPPPVVGGNLPVISRAAWGANERLRFKNGKEIWPREYMAPEKIILHHTETPNSQEPMAAIRAVYYFHSVTKGWGDIGYNYLVDHNGRIYEGRFGGANIIGGHTFGYNTGSLGIAVVGSYQSTALSAAAEEAIANLVASRTPWIDPIGQGWFQDRQLANIVGHRDCTSTSCPGGGFYPRLTKLRDRILQRIGSRPILSAQLSNVVIGPRDLRTGDRLEIRATVTNTGTAVLPADWRGAGLDYIEGQDFEQRGLARMNGRFRLAVDLTGAGGQRYAYRWGLGRNLLPGESVTVTGTIQLINPQDRTVAVALMQESIRTWQENTNVTAIHVTGPPIIITPAPPVEPTTPGGARPTERLPAPARPEANRRYFAETGHYLGFGFLNYWEKHGGLAQFGLPLTEEFRETNPADRKEYTVQYFERARFEYHPEFKGTPYEVLLGLLGSQVVGRSFAATPPGGSPPRAGAQYFPATQQWVGGPLLKYWNERGGLAIFGYPISPELEEVNPDDGKTYIVQYFERNRLEYHPEFKGTPNEVLLGLLGRQILVERGWLAR